MQQRADYGDVVRRGRALPARARRGAARRAASTPSASCSTRASASARRWRTTSRCWRASASCCALGWPLLAGWSRKSSLGTRHRPAGRASAWRPASPRRCWRCERGARIVRVHDVARDRRRAEVWRRRRPAHDRTIAARDSANEPMSRTYFGTDGIRGTVGAAADHARLHAAARPCRRPRAASAAESAADGADRQGHAHLGLHDRIGARGRLRLGRRRRAC